MLLSKQKIKRLLEAVKDPGDGQNLYAKCPKCGKGEFGISLKENHLFGCFRKKECGWTGNIFTLLKFLGKLKEFGKDEIQVENIDFLPLDLKEATTLDLSLPEIEMPLGFKRMDSHPYLNSRGFTKAQYEKYTVGVTFMKRGYVYIIIEQEKKPVAYVARSVRDKEWLDKYEKETGIRYLRYNNSKSNFRKILWGIDDVHSGSDIIMVEGPFDKTRIDTELSLDDRADLKCLCTFGVRLTEEHIALLRERKIKTLYLMYDPDVPKEIEKVATKAGDLFNTRVCRLDPGKDPNDMGEGELLDKLNNSITWLDYSINFINLKRR